MVLKHDSIVISIGILKMLISHIVIITYIKNEITNKTVNNECISDIRPVEYILEIYAYLFMIVVIFLCLCAICAIVNRVVGVILR